MSEAETLSISSPVQVTDLAPEHIPQAFPLVQIAYRNVTHEAWRRFALAHLAIPATKPAGRFPRRGIVTARSATGYFLGLFAWKLETDGAGDRVLTCNHFVLPAVAGLPPPLPALLERARRLAVFHQADMLVLYLPEDTEMEIPAKPDNQARIAVLKDRSRGELFLRPSQPGTDFAS